MKGHPYFERKWAPGLEKLKLTLDELTLGDSVKMRQAQWEAHERYRLDAYYQALEEHVNQLKEEAEIKLSQVKQIYSSKFLMIFCRLSSFLIYNKRPIKSLLNLTRFRLAWKRLH